MSLNPESVRLIKEVYENAGTMLTGKGKYTTINELTDQSPAARPEVTEAAINLLASVHPIPEAATVVLSEEDKGAILAGMFAHRVWLPLAMARHNFPYKIPGSVEVPLSMEYMDGDLLIIGLQKGDNVVLIDDTLASGGTMCALIKGIERAGAKLVDIRVVVEKLGFGGRERVSNYTDVPVRACVGISINPKGRITVEEVDQCRVNRG